MSLKHGDLKGTVFPKISLDEFQPKSGSTEDIIVVAFYLTDKDPAEDLNTFIQRSFIDTLDVEVSPNTDEEGNYLVFVEMDRNDQFPNKFQALIKDVENVSGKMQWKIKPYLSEISYEFNDPALFNFVIVDPSSYVSKEEFKMTDKEDIKEFFSNSYQTNLEILENNIRLSYGRNKIIAEVVDMGDYDTVISRNFLNESAFDLMNQSYEVNLLQGMMGKHCQVLPIDKFILLSNNNSVMILKNLQTDI